MSPVSRGWGVACLLLILSAPAAQGATVLFLHSRAFTKRAKADPPQIQRYLFRELGRQALLIAARDGVGMRTRDASLRETPATDEPLKLLLTVESLFTAGKPLHENECTLRVFQIDSLAPGEEAPPNDEAVWSKTFKYNPGCHRAYPSLERRLEPLIREEFPKLLRDLGGEAAEPAEEEGEEGIDVDELLPNTDVISQFVALRTLHSRLAADGGAGRAETLQSLVRAYANLALLTETSWGASSAVFKARAMLYAKRLEREHGEHPHTMLAVAYTHAVIGVHARAADYLKKAAIDADEYPEWAELVSPVCSFDTETLGALAQVSGEVGDWGAYLRAWGVFTSKEKRQLTDVCCEVVRQCPEAFPLYRMLTRNQPIGIRRYASSQETRALLRLTPKRLAEMPSIPLDVVDVVENPEQQEAPGFYWQGILGALRERETSVELSWGALATQLEDLGMQAAANSLSVNVAASTEQNLTPHAEFWEPFVSEHPNGGYVRLYCLLHSRQYDELQEAAADFTFTDPNIWMADDCNQLCGVRNAAGADIGKDGYNTAARDYTNQQVYALLRRAEPESSFYWVVVTEIRMASPKSPLVTFSEIKQRRASKKELTRGVVEGWEERAGSSSVLWREVAKAYASIDEREDAVRCYERSIELSPELDAFFLLANCYHFWDQKEKYVSTLERYLDYEDYGLGHTNVNHQIARYYMGEGDDKAAKPYALLAGRSHSAWGLQTAAVVCEKLGEKEEADEWYSSLSSGYPSSSGCAWYFFRKRQGMSDKEAAKRLALREFGPPKRWAASQKFGWTLAYLLLEGEDEIARKICQARAQSEPTLFYQTILLHFAVQANDEAAVAGCLEKLADLAVREQGDDSTPEWAARYVDLIKRVLAAKPENAQRVGERVEEFLDYVEVATLWKSDRAYFLGRLLELKGFDSAAGACYRRGADAISSAERITWLLSKVKAREHADAERTRAEAAP